MKHRLILIITLLSIPACSEQEQIPNPENKPAGHAYPAVNNENRENEKFTCGLAHETAPQFPGGLSALRAYMEKNIRQSSNHNHARKSAFVSFLVKKDGSITHVEILKGVNDSCDSIAVEIVRGMPRWEPGTFSGQKVPMRMVLPVKIEP